MEDKFQFDKKTIVNDGFTFRSWTWNFRELVLGLVVACLLVACVLMAAFLGKTSTDLKQAQTSAFKAQVACKDSTCLRTSAHIMELINASVDPCDDFFTFACGGYRVNNPMDEASLYQSIYKQMRQENEDQLVALLQSPSTRYFSWASEKKMKDFYSSCMDSFQREKVKGKPLFDYIFPPLGGWYVTDGASWRAANWNLNDPLKIVQSDLWVDAMYAPRPYPDDFASASRVIWIYPGGTSWFMSWNDYIRNATEKQRKLQSDYRQFMRTLAQLVSRDAGLSSASDPDLNNRIETFVNDAWEVEVDIAKFASSSEYQQDPHIEANRISLSDLTRQTGGEIDWTVQMSYLFNTAGITGNTKVVVPYPTYLSNFTAMIRSLGPAHRNRKLHNYLVWRVLEWNIFELSADYRHANRQFVYDKWGSAHFWTMEEICYWWTRWSFNDALGALYVNARFDMTNKKKVTEITEAIKTSMETMIVKNKWMDQTTKDYASKRVKESSYKIGFPDFMMDENKVDDIYKLVSINRSDYFGNIMECNKEHRRIWNKQIKEGEDRSQWYFSPFDTVLTVIWWWDQIGVPAGVLRFPMYEYDMPHYYSFGALGTILGRNVHHLIDEEGRHWVKGGTYLKSEAGWWSNSTLQNYNQARKCVADLYNNVTQGPYVSFNGQDKIVNVNGSQYAWQAMAITTGIRIAYNAYQKWQQQYGRDSIAPGLPYTPKQLFFIAHAQIKCYNMDPFFEYLYALYGRVHEDVRVNLAYQELPEFRQAFQCKASDKMVSAKPCTYY